MTDLLERYESFVDLCDLALEILLGIFDSRALKRVEIGIDLCDDYLARRILSAGSGVNYDLGNALDGADLVLYLLGIDVLAVRKDYEVLDPSGDVYPALFVESAEVASAEKENAYRTLEKFYRSKK